MNPLSMHGPEFLALYLPLSAGFLITAAVLKGMMLKAADSGKSYLGSLDEYEVAVLASGGKGAYLTALGSLSQRQIIDTIGTQLMVKNSSEKVTHPLEAAILQDLTRGKRTIPQVFSSVQPKIKDIYERLARQGLMFGADKICQVRMICFAVAVAPLVFLGLPKLWIGVTGSHPVGVLVVTGILALILSLLFFATQDRPTPVANRYLEKLRLEHAALRAATATSPGGLGAKELILASALFGGATVFGAQFAQARAALGSSSGCSGGSGCSSSSCSSSSSCGGGGGCGGCGGGGD